MSNARRARDRIKTLGDGESSIALSTVISSDEESEDDEDQDDEDDEPLDSEDEVAQKIGSLEEDVDQMYEAYQERIVKKDPKAFVESKKEKKKEFENWYGVEWDKKMGNDSTADPKSNDDEASDFGDSESSWGDETEDDDDEIDTAPANRKRKAEVSEPEPSVGGSSLSKRAKVFFDNPLFKGLTSEKSKAKAKGSFDKEMSLDDDSDDDDDEQGRSTKASRSEDDWGDDDDSDDDDRKSKKSGIEVVKNKDNDSDRVDDNFIIDTAEKYTMAQKLATKSGRRDMIDDGFNRYAFNDPDGLPSWFLEDENRHNKPMMPVTKEAIAIMRAKLKALDARPIKKVAEAKFRQKIRAENKMQKALKKASAIVEDEDAPENSKLRDAAKVMAKASAKKQKKKVQVVVAKHANRGIKGRPKGVKGRYKMVDGVMKKEMMNQKRKEKSKKKGKRRR